MSDNFSITKSVKGNLPIRGLPFRDMKDAVLGKKYELSLVFGGNALTKKLNELYRKKTYVPNVLSFPITKNSGEIFINPTTAAKEAKKFDRTPKNHIACLFIHGLEHLKGYTHGSRMDKAEALIRKKFRI